MKKYFVGIFYSLPIQLFLLHFKRHQIFLIFWYILFATIMGHFMETFGAYSLFLSPEYFGEVTFFSTAIVGFAIGIFIMGWNITTFILYSKLLKFLATTAQPFLKYCINNALIPIVFLLVYLFHAVTYNRYLEFYGVLHIAVLVAGFLMGLIGSIVLAFIYFFSVDKSIYHRIATIIQLANKKYEKLSWQKKKLVDTQIIRVDWFLSARLKLRKPRNVNHYSQEFLDTIFKRHNIAAVIAILIAFIFLILVGFISDNKLFQLPAAASITIFFTILIAAAGAVSLFFRSWTIPVLMLLYFGFNYLYQNNIIDLRNKAYGLNYQNTNQRPSYNKNSIDLLASDLNIAIDKKRMISVLNNWKQRQHNDKPIFYILNTSGGGTRSAAFTMNALQKLDSLFNGKLMQQTFLINGASGGLLGAAYFRELYYQKTLGKNINLQDKKYVDNISKDLLSPLFSSFVSRDIIGPVQKFTNNGYLYAKDRGYAFEQKLNENTEGVLDKPISAYDSIESKALIPTMFFNSVISRDGRKMVISTSPVRFLMKAIVDPLKITTADPDMIDFNALFNKQNANGIRVLSALRMNATFPYVLPNVWLPTEPIIDVMDAGLRDNFGQESALRFIDVFKDWLQENTSKVVLIEIRDRDLGDWDKPYEGNDLISILSKPFLLLQNNWFKLQDYYQYNQLVFIQKSYGPNFYRTCFQYIPNKQEATASLSFHLTTAEKKNISTTLNSAINKKEFDKLAAINK